MPQPSRLGGITAFQARPIGAARVAVPSAMATPMPPRRPVDGPHAVYGVRRRTLDPEVAEQWQVNEQGSPDDAFGISGPCAGCGHMTADVFFIERAAADQGAAATSTISTTSLGNVIISPLRFDFPRPATALPVIRRITRVVREMRTGQSPNEYVTEVQCSCVQDHGGESDPFGCGARFLIGATRNATGSASAFNLHCISAADEPLLWPQARSERDAAVASLAVVQASAAKWQTALTALLALLGVSSAIGGRVVVQALSADNQRLIIAAAFIALVSSAVGIWSAARVAAGSPRLRSSGDVGDIRSGASAPVQQARSAIKRFHMTLVASAVAFIFSVTTAALAWGLPAADVSTTVTVQFRDTTTAVSVCGSLVKNADADDVVMVKADGAVHSYDLADVKRIVPGGC